MFLILFRDAKKSHNAQLRAACESALAEIKQLITDDDTHGAPPPPSVASSPRTDDAGGDSVSVTSFVVVSSSSVLPDPSEMSRLNADKYFLPFDLACQSKSPRLTVIALDGIQKLIAYGHLTGEQPSALGRVGKNPGFKKKPAQWFFFVVFLVFFIFAQKREFFRVFQFQEYF
jgi:brefeldin A-inhibited guanine nucleotide-exchange protein